MPACNPIHSPLLIIAFHSNSSSGSKWPIYQAGQLQLNRAGGRHAHLGPNWERTCCWQPTGQPQCPRLCKPRGIFSRSLVTQCERGLKVPSEPRSLGLSFLLCRERRSSMQLPGSERPCEASQHLCLLFRKHLVTGPLPRLAHPWLGQVCT